MIFPLHRSGWGFRARREGFTLLEALMAVVLFGLLMLAVASLWNVSWRASEKIRQIETGGASPETVMKRLGEAAGACVFRSKPKELYVWETKDDRGGSGEADEISFVTSRAPDGASPHRGHTPLERIQVCVARASDGHRQLVLRAGPFTMAEGVWQREVVLLENVGSFRVRYWNKERGEWGDGWEDAGHVPEAVQFGLTLPGQSIAYAQEVWPYQAMSRVYPSIGVEAMDGSSTTGSATGAATNTAPSGATGDGS